MNPMIPTETPAAQSVIDVTDAARAAASETVRGLRPDVAADPQFASYAALPCPGADPAPTEIKAWEAMKGIILHADDPRVAAQQVVDVIRRERARKAAEVEDVAHEPTPHRPWCKPTCATDPQLGPTEHASAEARLDIPADMADAGVQDILSAEVFQDDDVNEQPRVSVNSGGNGGLMTADEVDAFADQLVEYAGQLRTFARHARQDTTGGAR